MMCSQCPIDYSAVRQHYNPNNADPSAVDEYGGYTSDYYIGAYSSEAPCVTSLTTATIVLATQHSAVWHLGLCTFRKFNISRNISKSLEVITSLISI